MHLYDVPLIFALTGLVLYTVLAGADFGAGLWQLLAGSGPNAQRVRDHAHHSMAAVWEANHVWLIFVLTVVWTAYPAAFGSIASTLEVPLFVAAVGIIFRGAAYALRAGTSAPRELRVISTVSGLSSVLTPFSLGAAVGAIASRRVPVGNAAGHLFSSWLNPTSILVGVLAVTTSAYLAAIFLTADAARTGDADLQRRFRARGLCTGILSGAIAFGGLAVLRSDAQPLYDRLTNGPTIAGVLISLLAGAATLALLWRRRFEACRYTAAVAVAATIAAWALAQNPTFLPGLTIQQAAASDNVLVAVIVAVTAGGAILFPSLGLLFRLVLRGQLDESHDGRRPAGSIPHVGPSPASGRLGRLAIACLIAGFGLLTVADAAWAHAIGVTALLSFVVLGFAALAPPQLPPDTEEPKR